jgi:hypothetical protein
MEDAAIMSYHLAQINIGTVKGPMDSEVMYGFASRLDEINAIADGAPGFVWRLQTPEGNATAIHVFEDERLLINMSVWEDIESLHQFTYYSKHVELYRQRADWFDKMSIPIMVLWWVPAGHIPSPDEAKEKLIHLEQHGPTPLAFTFKQRFTVEDMLAYTAGAAGD